MDKIAQGSLIPRHSIFRKSFVGYEGDFHLNEVESDRVSSTDNHHQGAGGKVGEQFTNSKNHG